MDAGKFKVYKCKNAPGRWGVQAIVYEHPLVGWTICCQGDYYIQLKDRFRAVGENALLDYVINDFDNVVAVWAGRTISNEEYQKIYRKAEKDMEAVRTGRLPWEQVIDD